MRSGPTGSEAARPRLAMRQPEPGGHDDRGSGPGALRGNFGEEEPAEKRREGKGEKAERRDEAGIRISERRNEQRLPQHDREPRPRQKRQLLGKICAVDDSLMILNIYRTVLTDLGYEPVLFQSFPIHAFPIVKDDKCSIRILEVGGENHMDVLSTSIE